MPTQGQLMSYMYSTTEKITVRLLTAVREEFQSVLISQELNPIYRPKTSNAPANDTPPEGRKS